MKYCHLRSWLALSSILLCLSDSNYSVAQIVPDATLPNNSIVTPQGNTSVIEGGTRAGGNLFHSFREFSIPTGGEAFFNNALDVQNIFSRVTGGSISNIDGLIRANGTANLFLLNPNGIIFGSNARLNIGGSFFGSTASSIRFNDGTEFSAANPQATPLLTISVPIGLQYGSNPGRITVQGQGQNLVSQALLNTPEQVQAFINAEQTLLNDSTGLQVQPGRTLALVGGEVTLEGGLLKAPEGRLEIGSVAGSGLVSLNPIDTGWTLGYEGVPTFGNIQLSQRSLMTTSGNGGGNVQVRGSQVTLADESAILAHTFGNKNGIGISIQANQLDVRNGSIASVDTFGTGSGGTLTVNASQSVELAGTAADGQTFSSLVANTFGPGAAGSLTITTGRLTAQGGAGIQANTAFSQGQGGTLTINASESVELSGTTADGQNASGIVTTSSGSGAAGNLTINTGRLILTDGATVSASTFGAGQGGNLSVTASEAVEVSGTRPNGLPTQLTAGVASGQGSGGNGGNLTIETGTLSIRDGGSVSTATFGQGNAGNLQVRARNLVEVVGEGAATPELPGGVSSSLSSAVGPNGVGNGGNLTIETGTLSIRDGGEVVASVFGQGKGGDIQVQATNLVEVVGAGRVRESQGGRTRLSSGIFVDVLGNGVGQGGNINIATQVLSLRDGGLVTASTFGRGNAGNIQVQASNRVEVIGAAIDGSVSSINTQVLGGAVGQGGNINIGTQVLSLRNGGNISAGTSAEGNAGNIQIRATDAVELVGVSPNASQLASGLYALVLADAKGSGGNITVETGRLTLKDGNISASTDGDGNAGDILLQASDAVESSGNSFINTVTGAQATGNGGRITIETGRLQLADDSDVAAFTLNQGRGGNITVRARESVRVIGNSSLTVFTSGAGNAGDVTIETRQLIFQNGADVLASTGGLGNAGNIQIRATDAVELVGDSTSLSTSVFPGATGKGGNVTVETRRLTLQDGATISSGTSGNGDAGTIFLQASESVELSGDSDIFANTLSTDTFTSSVTGQAGNITIETGRLYLTQNSSVSALTSTRGAGGAIAVRARESVQLLNGSRILVFTFGAGDAGSISVTAPEVDLAGDFTLENGRVLPSGLSAQSQGTGAAGDVRINAGRLIVRDGAQVDATTFEAGKGGTLTVTADEVELSGTGADGSFSGLFAVSNGSGTAGDVTIDTGRLIVRDGGTVSVGGIGSGGAGNLNITASSVELDNNGFLGGSTAAGNRGNITVNSNSLILRRGSNITTNATGEATGGNITLDTNVLAALEDSDINANAQQSFGGQVRINAQAIFGTQFRAAPILDTPESDITASSAAGPQFGGTVTINTPNVDPSSGLIELPQNLVDVSGLIVDPCAATRQGSRFTVTGRGGIPAGPDEPLSGEAFLVDLITIPADRTESQRVSPQTANEETGYQVGDRIIEATGWIINDKGQVVLTASTPNIMGDRWWRTSPGCTVSPD